MSSSAVSLGIESSVGLWLMTYCYSEKFLFGKTCTFFFFFNNEDGEENQKHNYTEALPLTPIRLYAIKNENGI